MARCYKEDCGPYKVSPILVAPCYPSKRSEEPPMCFPCLPRCGSTEPCTRSYDRRQDERVEHYKKEERREHHQHGDSYERRQPRRGERCEHHHDDCCKHHHHDDCCDHHYHDCCSPRRRCHSPRCCSPAPRCCPTCSQPTCVPVKTKYIMPCYRYEDGRIERYVPTRRGRLPMSAYRRNGMQDQVYGYRGAQKYLCAGESPVGTIVCMAVQPMQRLFPKVTQEMWPVKRRKDKK